MAALQTPWYDKAVEALKLNGKGERTQEAYARHAALYAVIRKLLIQPFLQRHQQP